MTGVEVVFRFRVSVRSVPVQSTVSVVSNKILAVIVLVENVVEVLDFVR